MKRICLLSLVLLLSDISTASAIAEIGAYFEPFRSRTCTEVAPGVPFDIYIIVESAVGGIGLYQFGLQLDPRLTLVGEPTIYPEGAVDTGDDSLVEGLNFVVDAGESCVRTDEPEILVHLRAVAPVTDDELRICFSVGVSEDLTVAGYLRCSDGGMEYLNSNIHRPGCAPSPGCSVVRATTVPAPSGRWGPLKASFGPSR